MQGWAPTPLNDRGNQQAARLGERLTGTYDTDRIVASDLLRTRETVAQLVGAGVDAEPLFDRAWRERALGRLQGYTRAELREQFPAFAMPSGTMALEEPPDGGESLADMYDRICAAWTALSPAPGETVLVVTHGGPITALLATLKDQDMLTAIEHHDIANCSLTAVVPETGEIRKENVQPFEAIESPDER